MAERGPCPLIRGKSLNEPPGDIQLECEHAGSSPASFRAPSSPGSPVPVARGRTEVQPEPVPTEPLINLQESQGEDRLGPKFSPGDLVRHKRYGYRGVVVAVDEQFSGSEAWYQKNQTQPPKDQPWYHVLVDNGPHVTYPAETSLELDGSGEEVDHPLLEVFFADFRGGKYIRNDVEWDF